MLSIFCVSGAFLGVGIGTVYPNLMGGVCDHSDPSWRGAALGEDCLSFCFVFQFCLAALTQSLSCFLCRNISILERYWVRSWRNHGWSTERCFGAVQHCHWIVLYCNFSCTYVLVLKSPKLLSTEERELCVKLGWWFVSPACVAERVSVGVFSFGVMCTVYGEVCTACGFFLLFLLFIREIQM